MTDQQRRDEPSAAFKPKRMKLSVLTAAFQELTPRSRRDPDPDLAIEEWLDFASTMKCPNIQLSAAVHRSLSDVPAEALLDPVANTLDLRGTVRPHPCRAGCFGDEEYRGGAVGPRLF